MAATKELVSCLACPDGRVPMTGVCPKCGSVYRRGALIEERGRVVKRRIPKTGVQGKESGPVNLDRLPFYHYENAPTRLDAINRMYDYYDRVPGRRRKPAREAFEVLQARDDGEGVWVITVRRI